MLAAQFRSVAFAGQSIFLWRCSTKSLCKEHQRHNNFDLDAAGYWDQYQIAVCNTDSVATAADGFEFFDALFESFAARPATLSGGISFPTIRKWQGELTDRETKLRQAGILPAADPVVSYTKYFEGTIGPVPEHYFQQKPALPLAVPPSRQPPSPQQQQHQPRQRSPKK